MSAQTSTSPNQLTPKSQGILGQIQGLLASAGCSTEQNAVLRVLTASHTNTNNNNSHDIDVANILASIGTTTTTTTTTLPRSVVNVGTNGTPASRLQPHNAPFVATQSLPQSSLDVGTPNESSTTQTEPNHGSIGLLLNAADEVRKTKFRNALSIAIISDDTLRIGSKIHKLQTPITYDNMSQDINDQVQVPGLHTFDITLTTKTQSYPDHGIYFILLQTIGGKWKILYGMSKGSTYKNNNDGLFLRIKTHMADVDVLGEVITFYIPKTVVKDVETMVKMSMLDLRPLLSCGTEIAVFDTREAALLCLSTWANILPNLDRGSTSASIPANYNDLEGVQLTIDDYKDEEHKERRTAATSILPAGPEVIQEYYKEKRGKYVLVLCV